MVPTWMPLRRHAFRSSAASTWSDSVGHEERQRTEALDDRVAGLRSAEALQQLLQHEPGREDPLPRFERLAQALDGRLIGPDITAQRERPHAGVDEEVHSAGALGLVVVLRVPVEGREELDDAPLLMASDVLAQRTGDRCGLGALTTDLDGLLEQARVDIEVGRHVRSIAQRPAQRQSWRPGTWRPGVFAARCAATLSWKARYPHA